MNLELELPAVRRLSYELWAHIFTLCLPSTKFVRPSPYDAPLQLCSVSQEWRQIALCTPQLWSSLAIRISHPCHLTPTFIQNWLARSGALPLSIALETPFLCPRSAEDTLDRTVEVLFSYSHRWLNASFALSAPIGNALPTLDHAPLLRDFSLHPSPFSRNKFSIPFTLAPHLRRFKWAPCWDLLAVQGIPWHQLTHLTLERGLSLYGCFEALTICPKLIQCGLTASLVQHFIIPPNPLHHTHLRILRITADEHLGPFLDSLNIPTLQKLDIDIEDDYVYDADTGRSRPVDPLHPHLVGLLDRSGCKLESLTLRNAPLSTNELIDCLQTCSDTMRSLTICNGRYKPVMTDPIITRLTLTPSPKSSSSLSTPLCPRLVRLHLINCLDASEGLLGRMVASRYILPSNSTTTTTTTSSSPEGHTLCHFSGVIPYALPEQDAAILQECVWAGLVIAFRDSSTTITF
ncbi:hypothetical protein AMATHDRAFT_51292 [Amanita thiersii Skay4041]|uniref:F-box domain-containing protein n=1 Tax=Amanita thiersii Skay4041 TaxID=703135 RepID=A0A2A9N8G8_9AGAR|nr:hypothetical protein AMATHDRAFT_51292 [Amanita thiersii Skay4041]